MRPGYLSVFFRFRSLHLGGPIPILNNQGDDFVMSKRSLPLYLAILALVTMSASAFAKNEASDTITTKLKLTAATTVAGTQVPAGEYKVIADGSKAKFMQGSKVVAGVP